MIRLARLAALLVGAMVILVLSAGGASAHPLGNFTVNYYEGLRLSTTSIDVTAIVDAAELPTYQTVAPAVDRDRNAARSPAEEAAYAGRECGRLAVGLRLTVNDRRVPLTVRGSRIAFLPSSALRGLYTSRLSCDLSAPADLHRRAAVRFTDSVDRRYGWHEITAVGTDVHVTDSAVIGSGQPVDGTSVSDELRNYPNNLLSAPLDVRSVRFTAVPGAGAVAAGRYAVSGSSALVRALEPLTGAFYRTAAVPNLTVPVGLLALALAIALGCGHAALPGHGKTVMAAYLVGRRGSLRDAVLVGATVTFTHTAGVLLLGLAISVSAQFVGTDVLRYLGALSGLLIAAVGVGLLRSALRARRAAATHGGQSVPISELVGAGVATRASAHLEAVGGAAHHHGHDHDGHDHDHSGPDHHAHSGPDHHAHSGPDHHHGPGHDHGLQFSRRGLVGMGVAGGLVPSPSALVVLLSAVALGRTLFGVALVVGYGVGMAATLMATGLLLVRLRGRLDRLTSGRRFGMAERYVRAVPVLTALLVLIVGLGLAARAVGSPV